jgi:hypothetical protein
MPPTLPFWFKQRQCKAEPTGSDFMLKVSGPNLPDAFLRIEQDANGQWKAAVRLSADGPDVSATDVEIPTPWEAWEAAFELYRLLVIA